MDHVGRAKKRGDVPNACGSIILTQNAMTCAWESEIFDGRESGRCIGTGASTFPTIGGTRCEAKSGMQGAPFSQILEDASSWVSYQKITWIVWMVHAVSVSNKGPQHPGIETHSKVEGHSCAEIGLPAEIRDAKVACLG